MYASKFWNSIHLSSRKIILLNCFFFLVSFSASAQEERMSNAEHDDLPYYFGITIGINSAQYRLTHSKYFIQNDSVVNITPLWKPGFQLGIVGNLKLSNFIDLRTIPSFVLREKALKFNLMKDSVLINSFESILFSMPLELKFKSDRQTNFRFYVVAGIKLDYDFNSNTKAHKEEDIIRIKPLDFGYNLGLGFEFYYPNFIFAPEIKLSNGIGNSLDRNVGEPTNKAIDKITTRMIVFSIHIEG